MPENINHKEAEKILLQAFRKRCSKDDKISGWIEAILKGDHKTYKYILLTGLLAKATNPKTNALALQAGAPILGAYDARSLCHSVIVPFERDFLHKGLGASNEPFLNKPARFTHLSKTNAVRKGKDKLTLTLLIRIFESIETAEDAKGYLACALGTINEGVEASSVLHDTTIKYDPTLVEVYEFILKFLEKSHEGESSAIIVGTLEKIFHSKLSGNYKVDCHKVNQSGASSKEIGDIDILKDDSYFYSIEVKDKDFTRHDIEHAMQKIMKHGGKKGQFIFGPRGDFDKHEIKSVVKEFQKQSFLVIICYIFNYAKTMIFKIDLQNKQEFMDALLETAIEINAKDESKRWIQEILVQLSWK